MYSYKLKNHKFISIKDLNKINSKSGNFRVGVLEMVEGFNKYLELKKKNIVFNPFQYKSNLNYYLLERR